MKNAEYILSVMLALLLLGGTIAWTQVTTSGDATALSCKPGRTAPPVVLKGLSVYPRCTGGKRG
jgi:hypothetical protein